MLVDEDIELELPAPKKKYPKKLRRIAIWNEEHCFVVELLTNTFTLAASTLAAIYKARWNIEIFFRNHGAASAHKELQRYHMQRCGNPDMDGTDNYAHPDMAETHRQVQVAKLVVFLRLNTFTKIDLNNWLNEPFTPPPE